MTSRNKRVFTLLKKQSKTKADMARALNISKSAVTQWEKNHVEPSYEQCVVLSNFFDVPVTYLYDGLDEKDIKKTIDSLKHQLSSIPNLVYDGKPINNDRISQFVHCIDYFFQYEKDGVEKEQIIRFEQTPISSDRMEERMKTYYYLLNNYGREKVLEYAIDLVASDRYSNEENNQTK